MGIQQRTKVSALIFFLIFIYLFGCARSSLQHVGSSSLTRVPTQGPCIGSTES